MNMKWIPMINCGLCAGESPMCWDGEAFDTEEACQEWIDESMDDFTPNEMGGCVFPYELAQ